MRLLLLRAVLPPGDIQTSSLNLPPARTFAQHAGGCRQPIKDEERIFTPRASTARIVATR